MSKKFGPIQFSFGARLDPFDGQPALPGAVELEDVTPDEADDELEELAPLAPGQPPVRTARPRPPAAAPQITSTNLVELAKARILALKTELESMSKLQAEHDALERLVAAAEPPSLSTH